jgi:alpha-1,3-rhamnosyl/mannosyltransferase
VKRATAVICLSEFSKRELVEFTGVDTSKVHVVYHGLPPSHPITDVTGERKTESPGYLLCLAHLQPYKNVLRAIDAYAQLRLNHRVEQRFRIIGFEAQYTARDIQDYAMRRGVSDGVDFLGPVGHEDLRAHYLKADLMVYPSLYETFGLPPLEAMAAGCPVVASNSTAIPEVVGDAAELVDPLDASDIARGILHVLGDPTWRLKLIARGRSRASQFTWDKAARSTLTILREAVGVAKSHG